MPDGKKDTLAQFKANTEAYASIITTVRKFCHKLTPEEIRGPPDFVFMDGDHSEDGVRADFRLIAPSVKSGGLISFHDLIFEFPGVNIVEGEALASGDWQLVRLTGSLGVLRKVRA